MSDCAAFFPSPLAGEGGLRVCEGRMKGRAALSKQSSGTWEGQTDSPVQPLIRHAQHDTFSRKGRRKGCRP
jgi:hypothetical protein